MSERPAKIAIVYYTRSGHSQNMAELLATQMRADLFPLQVNRYAAPIFGYIRAGYDSLRQTWPVLIDPLPPTDGYEAVIVGGPVWTSYPAPPIRSYLAQAQNLPSVFGLFVTYGGQSPPEKAFATAEHDLGRPFTATTAITNEMEDTNEALDRIAIFAAAMRDALRSDLRIVQDVPIA